MCTVRDCDIMVNSVTKVPIRVSEREILPEIPQKMSFKSSVLSSERLYHKRKILQVSSSAARIRELLI